MIALKLRQLILAPVPDFYLICKNIGQNVILHMYKADVGHNSTRIVSTVLNRNEVLNTTMQ